MGHRNLHFNLGGRWDHTWRKALPQSSKMNKASSKVSSCFKPSERLKFIKHFLKAYN